MEEKKLKGIEGEIEMYSFNGTLTIQTTLHTGRTAYCILKTSHALELANWIIENVK